MRHDYRLFLPALAVWFGTVLLLSQPEQVIWGATAIAICLFGALSLAVGIPLLKRRGRKRRPAPVLLVMLLVAAAMFSAVALRISVEHELRSPKLLIEAVRQGAEVTFSATATSSIQVSGAQFGGASQQSVRAVVTQISVGGTSAGVSVPVNMTLDSASMPELGIGSSLSGVGKFVPARHSNSVAFQVHASDIRASSPPAFLLWAEMLRASLRGEAQQLTGWGSELIPGLAVGDTELVSDSLDAAMKGASLSHLTAVSGANCAIITGLILLVGRGFRLRVWIRVGLALVFLLMFVVLVTPEPSVLRAAVMSVLAMVSLLSARRAIGTAALAVAMISLLIIDPWQAVHFGFILSVLATAGIILFTQPLATTMRRWLPNWLALVISVPLAAQMTCQPAILLLEPSLPVLGVLANVLAAPAAPVATVTGLIACILVPIWPWAGAFATWLTWFPASWIALIAALVESVPRAQLPWIPGWAGATLLATIVAAVLIALLLPRALPLARTRARFERVRMPLLSIALSTLTAIAIVHPWATREALPANWRMYVCDVGQGDAVLVRGSGGTLLIDTGMHPQRIEECLSDASIQRVDLLVLTHDDADHVGGVAAVLPRTALALVAPQSDSDDDRPLVSSLEQASTPIRVATAGMRGSLGDLNWRVLWPTPNSQLSNRNDASVVIRVDTPEMTAVFLGDLGEQAQRSLLASQRLAPADIVKVSHHGSSDQSAELYETLSANFGVVSVGEDNGYGHPTQAALDLLRRAETTALRTDQLGAFALARATGGEWVLWQSPALG